MGALVLGLNPSDRDSAAALVDQTGRILYALTEERFSNVKHDAGFPLACLLEIRQKLAGRALGELRHIAVSAPLSPEQQQKLDELFPGSKSALITHADAHHASAFYTSGFPKAALLCLDDSIGQPSVVLGKGDQTGLHKIAQSEEPHSLGLLYTAFTHFLGFKSPGDSFKVMGMAAYGTSRFWPLFERLAHVDAQGRLSLLLGDQLDFDGKDLVFKEALTAQLGSPRRTDEAITQTHYDIAWAVQHLTEETALAIARALHAAAPSCDSLCLSGGIALNGRVNQRLFKEAGFKKMFVQPAATDEGLALGAALALVADTFGAPPCRRLENVFLGPDRSPTIARETLETLGLSYTKPEDMAETVATLLAQGSVVARFAGRSEFGPRALGNRSILADPRKAEMKDILNDRIKRREPFRPFAPACLAEEVPSFFDADEDAEYMLLICGTHEEKKRLIPAVVHADGTARVQSVKKSANPSFYKIIEVFHAKTGLPVLINTSFNINGETIVETPLDAIECFLHTDIDYLVLEDWLVSKKENAGKKINSDPALFLSRRKERYCPKVNPGSA